MIHELLNWCYWNCARSVDIKMCSLPSMPPPDPFFTFVFLLALSPNYKFVFLNKLRRPTSAKDKKEIFPNFWYNAEDNRANDGPFVHLKLIF